MIGLDLINMLEGVINSEYLLHASFIEQFKLR